MSKLRAPEHRCSVGVGPTTRASALSPGSPEAPSFQFAGAKGSPGGPQTGAAVCGGGGGSGAHIHVAVRVRPLPGTEEGIIEVAGSGAIAIKKDAATGGNEFLSSQQGRIEERTFDQVFGPEATQKQVYDRSCAPLIKEAVQQGKSATVFVYGATGAGKTHTMFGGQDEQRGLMLRAVPEVFRQLQNVETEVAGSFEVRVSFLELYNEVVRDLLQPLQGEGAATAPGACRVLEDAQRGVVKIANLMEAVVRSSEEALWYLQAGMQARTVEATAANSQSSRAHAVFALTIEHVREQARGNGPFARRGTQVRTLYSKISLIDLAGSERAALTQNIGSALKDGARINQSLLALANCIDALTQRTRDGGAGTPRKKPPYRDSKLTLMLKGSLTGDGLVAMIANVHPGRNHFEDSNNTLEYAKRASTVRVSRRSKSATSPQGTPATVPTGGLHASPVAGYGGGSGGDDGQIAAPGPGPGSGPTLGRGTAPRGDKCNFGFASAGTGGTVGGGVAGAAFVPRTTSGAETADGDNPTGGVTRRRRDRLDHARARMRQPCSAEPTTASNSPEDCLSEISLSIAGPEECDTSPEPSPESSDVGQCASSDGQWCGGEDGEDDGSFRSTTNAVDTTEVSAEDAIDTSADVATEESRGEGAAHDGAPAGRVPPGEEASQLLPSDAPSGALSSAGVAATSTSAGASASATREPTAASVAAAVATATAAVARCTRNDTTSGACRSAARASSGDRGRGTTELSDGGLTHANCSATASDATCQQDDSLPGRIVATLRAEKAQLESRLTSVLRQREALLQDRRELEQENEKLRASNLEKDHQVALLLDRCAAAEALRS